MSDETKKNIIIWCQTINQLLIVICAVHFFIFCIVIGIAKGRVQPSFLLSLDMIIIFSATIIQYCLKCYLHTIKNIKENVPISTPIDNTVSTAPDPALCIPEEYRVALGIQADDEMEKMLKKYAKNKTLAKKPINRFELLDI